MVWLLGVQVKGHDGGGGYIRDIANGILGSSEQWIWRWRCTATSGDQGTGLPTIRPWRCHHLDHLVGMETILAEIDVLQSATMLEKMPQQADEEEELHVDQLD